METTALAVVANEEALGLPSGPMTDSEKRDRHNKHLELKKLSEGIGSVLSYIYNNRLFRGDDGKQSWETYLEKELPEWLEAVTPRAADYQRLIHEATVLIEGSASSLRGQLALTTRQADILRPLIPRKILRHEEGSGGSWNPAILDDPDAAEGIAKVWELACTNAEANQRRNGPTAEDVRAAREELRPVLEQKGLIRSAPAAFQAATAARVEAAQQRTINVTAVDPVKQEREAAAFRETMANIRETKAERQVKVKAEEVREELSKADRERAELLQQEVRAYNTRLHCASKAIHELHGYLQNLSRIHGTQLLDEMRCIDVLGLITVQDDMQRLQEMGQELMEAVKLARSSEPSTGINMQTINL